MPCDSNLVKGEGKGRFSGTSDLLQRDEYSRDREAAKHKAWVCGGQSYCNGRGRFHYGKIEHLFTVVEGKGENN